MVVARLALCLVVAFLILACDSAGCEDKAWAATKQRAFAGGLRACPVGEYCEECYIIGTEAFGFASVKQFEDALSSDADLEEKVARARHASRHPSDRAFPAKAVLQNVTWEVEIAKPVVGFFF